MDILFDGDLMELKMVKLVAPQWETNTNRIGEFYRLNLQLCTSYGTYQNKTEQEQNCWYWFIADALKL